MSAIPPKADMVPRDRDVRFVPKAVTGALPAPAGGQAVGIKHSHRSIGDAYLGTVTLNFGLYSVLFT